MLYVYLIFLLAPGYCPYCQMAEEHDGFMICIHCGGGHKARRQACPAWGQTCPRCRIKHHTEKQCEKYHAEHGTGFTSPVLMTKARHLSAEEKRQIAGACAMHFPHRLLFAVFCFNFLSFRQLSKVSCPNSSGHRCRVNPFYF